MREGRQHWDTQSRQYLLALEVSVEAGEVQLIARDATTSDTAAVNGRARHGRDADDGTSITKPLTIWRLTNPEAAIAAYRRCLAANEGHLEARANCGRLLHLAGRLVDAEKIYREAPEPDATVLFNLAVLLEDSGREDEAMQVYRLRAGARPRARRCAFQPGPPARAGR